MSTATATATRRPVNPTRQLLRLTRTELTLLYRYRTAFFLAVVMPLVFVFPLINLDQGQALPGVDGRAFSFAAFFAICATTVGLLHVSNIYAARREQLVLKRLRASGVPAMAIFGATLLSVIGIVGMQSVAIIGLTAATTNVLPADPLLLLVSILLTCLVMTLLGVALTRYTRNAESTQMISMLPFFFLIAASGAFIPLDVMPPAAAALMRMFPTAPAVELARSAYFGFNLFAGTQTVPSPSTGADLWMAAVPSLVMLASWAVILVPVVRRFRWDPREAG